MGAAVQGYDVWGFTAGVLIEVAQLVYGRPPEFEEVGATEQVQLLCEMQRCQLD